ncbi:hypothetical protein SAMD00024442_26_14 [Candidatus Symbiothrix dinenymphae]|nr:hypothetical protein SAMD00024442_26_14 [Candidatus Symbiothrix dinenymphae]
MLEEYMVNRKPTKEEEKLIEHLISLSLRKFSSGWKEKIFVRSMDDGGMGSLIISLDESSTESRLFGEQISEYCFVDEDGVDVIASLNIDDTGDLYELDIWKTDFSPLIKLPWIST